jgi:ribosomal protein S6
LKTYEAMFIFPNKYSEEKLKSALKEANKEIVNHGGEIKGVVEVGSRRFSRPMHKKTAGQYVKVLFDIEPSQIAVLTGRYKLNDDVFRFQLVVADEVIIGNYNEKPEEVTEETVETKETAK